MLFRFDFLEVDPETRTERDNLEVFGFGVLGLLGLSDAMMMPSPLLEHRVSRMCFCYVLVADFA